MNEHVINFRDPIIPFTSLSQISVSEVRTERWDPAGCYLCQYHNTLHVYYGGVLSPN